MSILKTMDWYQFTIHFILILLCLLVWQLSSQNSEYRKQLSSMTEKVFVKEGETIHPIKATDLDGKPREYKFINKTTIKYSIIYFFTSECPYCTKNINTWKKIYNEFAEKINILGIGIGNLNEIKNYSKTNSLPYQVIVPVSNTFRKDYKIGGVPLTVLLSDSGKVLKVWKGYNEKDGEREIRDYLNKMEFSLK